MASLATISDLEDRLGRTFAVGAETDQAQAALDDASAAIRAYTGQQFDLVTDDEVRLRASNGTVRLPQRPVVDVTAVANTEAQAVEFTWDAGSDVFLSGFEGLRSWEIEPYKVTRPLYVDVTYSHGYATVPDDIVAVVCQVAGRALGRTADATAVTQESIAGYSYSVSGAAASGALGFTLPERQVLDRYRRPIGTIQVTL